MTKNVGTADRWLRVVGAALAGVCALEAPVFAPAVRLALFGGTAAYLLVSALAGTCLGYRLMGKSTCSVGQRA